MPLPKQCPLHPLIFPWCAQPLTHLIEVRFLHQSMFAVSVRVTRSQPPSPHAQNRASCSSTIKLSLLVCNILANAEGFVTVLAALQIGSCPLWLHCLSLCNSEVFHPSASASSETHFLCTSSIRGHIAHILIYFSFGTLPACHPPPPFPCRLPDCVCSFLKTMCLFYAY